MWILPLYKVTKRLCKKWLSKASVITILILTHWTTIYWTLTKNCLTRFVRTWFLTMRCMQVQRSSLMGFKHVRAMTSLVLYLTNAALYGWTYIKMLRSTTLTAISGGALSVDLEAAKVSKTLWFECRSTYSSLPSKERKSSTFNTSTTGRGDSHHQTGCCSPEQTIGQSYQFTVYSSQLSCGEKSRHSVGLYNLSTWK